MHRPSLRRRWHVIVDALLTLVVPFALGAQAPEAAIPTALRVLTSGPGGCGVDPERTPAAVGFFPAVRFTRGSCILEHGDSAIAIVGMDSSHVLYLLDSKKAFNFLAASHPPSGLGAANVLSYAYTALALSGTIIGTVPVTKYTELPAAARETVRRKVERLTQVEAVGGHWWHVTVVTRAAGGYYQPSFWYHELDIDDSGQVEFGEPKLLWSDPRHP
jgi:hypothetical protein